MKGYVPALFLLVLFCVIYIFTTTFTPVNFTLMRHSQSGAIVLPGKHDVPLAREVLERQEIERVASDFVAMKKPGQSFRVYFYKEANQWALVNAIFLTNLDQSQVLLQKIDGRWVGAAFGPDVSGWKKLVPELFSH